MYKAFIVEDEAPASNRVKKLLVAYQTELTLVGEAQTGAAAIEQIESLKPEVLFLDIQLPDMTGFAVLAALTYQPLVIFTTAYEKYAIKAFENFSIDYLLKPFDAHRFERAIRKLMKFGLQQTAINYQALENSISNIKKESALYVLPVKLGDRIRFFEVDNIVYFKAEDKYVRIYLKNAKNYLYEKSLRNLEERLPANFMRVHRSYIINRQYLLEARKYFKGQLLLQMTDKEETVILTGAKYIADVKRILGL